MNVTKITHHTFRRSKLSRNPNKSQNPKTSSSKENQFKTSDQTMDDIYKITRKGVWRKGSIASHLILSLPMLKEECYPYKNKDTASQRRVRNYQKQILI